MPGIDDLVKKLPPETQSLFRYVWDTIPTNDRNNLLLLINSFPSDVNLMRMLVNLATVQVKLAFGQKHRVAIVGPANVGKSTLYNQLIRKKDDHAKVSPLPGTTRANQQADAGLFSIIDTPGADAVGEVGEKEREQALQAAEQADFLIIIFDAIQGVKKTELELYEKLLVLKKPYVIVLNKVDLVRSDTQKIVDHAASVLKLNRDQIIPIVAKNAENLSQVLMAIAVSEPEIVAALGQALPQYRWQLAWRTIISAATVTAAIALAPLPVIDFFPLIVAQSVMVLGIARIYNFKITLQRARELVVAFGLGYLGRTLFQELSKLGGVPGWLLSAAIASSTTVVMGYAAVLWFDKGEKLSNASFKRLSKEITQSLISSLKDLGKRKPNKKSLQERIAQSLENSPIAEDRTILDSEAQTTTEKPIAGEKSGG
jgi:small GTP-binding protein